MFCTFCGKMNADNHKFCSGCGKELKKPAQSMKPVVETKPDYIICSSCGKQNPGNYTFCSGCGGRIQTMESNGAAGYVLEDDLYRPNDAMPNMGELDLDEYDGEESESEESSANTVEPKEDETIMTNPTPIFDTPVTNEPTPTVPVYYPPVDEVQKPNQANPLFIVIIIILMILIIGGGIIIALLVQKNSMNTPPSRISTEREQNGDSDSGDIYDEGAQNNSDVNISNGKENGNTDIDKQDSGLQEEDDGVIKDYENPLYQNGYYGRSERESVLAFRAPQPIDGLDASNGIPVQYFDPSIHEYMLFVEDVTYEEAKERCENMGGHLVTIVCKEEADLIYNLLVDYGHDPSEYKIWMGMTLDVNHFPTFCTFENPGISFWAPGEPSKGEKEFYSSMTYDYGADKWNWYDEEERLGEDYNGKTAYLCEWEVITDWDYYENLMER